MDKDFSYKIEDNYQYIVDTKGDTTICLSKMSWNGGPYKLDLRKWYRRGEELIPQRGLSFLTDDGPNKLAELLVEKGFGDTQTIQNILNKRPNEKKQTTEKMYTSNKLLDVIKK